MTELKIARNRWLSLFRIVASHDSRCTCADCQAEFRAAKAYKELMEATPRTKPMTSRTEIERLQARRSELFEAVESHQLDCGCGECREFMDASEAYYAAKRERDHD